MSAIDTLLRDLKHAFRILRKDPAFTVAALAALTLGVGVNTAVFSVVDAVLLRPIGVPEPDRLVFLTTTSPQGSGIGASPAKFQHWRRQTDALSQVSAFRSGVVNYTGGVRPEELRLLQVSADFMTLLGATVIEGRPFSAEDDVPNGAPVVVVSQSVRDRLLGGGPTAVGRTLSLAGVPHTVIGVLGDFDFREFGEPPEVLTPFQIDPDTTEQGHYFQAVARLVPGVTLEQADAQLVASAEDFRNRFPEALPEGGAFGVARVRDVLVSNARTSLLVLTGAVAFVLLIACANVASLLLARTAGRGRELAVRSAIGGSRGRIVRQLLTENLVLSCAGGALGLGLGVVGIRLLLSINTAGLPRVGDGGALVGLDWRVASFALGVSLATGLLFGLLPALVSSRLDLTTALKEGGRSGSGAQNRARTALVVAEVALALVLLVGSALLIRTAVAIARVDPGFDATNVLTMRTSLTRPELTTSAGVAGLVRVGTQRLRAVPGVADATAACCVPLEDGYGLGFVISGRPLEGPAHGGAAWMTVSPGYFEVFQIALIRGRLFTDRDDAAGVPVVVINETMARQFWPEGDPLADRLTIGRAMREFETESERQIIGIVADTRDSGLNADPRPRMFIPQAQLPDAANALNARLMPMAWFVRTRAPATPALAQSIEDALVEATGLPVANRRAMDDVVSASTSRERFNMWLMSIFGASALLLAAIGIYGLMAYSVSQRTREIGIRLALGARASEVRRLVVVQGMRLAAAGIGLGLAASFGLARFLTSFLYGVTERDALVFSVVPLVLTLVAFAAVWVPARRASAVDPLRALRNE